MRTHVLATICLIGMSSLLASCGGGGGGGGNVGASTGSGQNGGNNAPPVSSVSGSVTFNGAALSGVTITVYNTNTNTVAATATTDAAGHYAISGLFASTSGITQYQLWASKAGYGFQLSAGAGSAVKRSDYTGQYNSPYGIYKTVIEFNPMPDANVTAANFVAVDGRAPIISPAATGQVTSYAPGDDGALGAGVSASAPRFVSHADGTVTDNLTGLVWLRDAGCLGSSDWNHAITSANQLASGACGLTDGSTQGQWRLPNINELSSLIDASNSSPALPSAHPFTNVSNGTYWSSTTYFGLQTSAWALRLGDGRFMNDSSSNDKTASSAAIWAVRGTSAGAGKLAATGQYVAFAKGDDGDAQAGSRLTFARWIDNGNGTLTDTVTGLIWLKQADCIHQTWSNVLAAVNALASGQCGLSDGSSAGQWRVPNRNELLSLSDRALSNHADFFDWNYVSSAAVGNQPPIFGNLIVNEYYWTSTTDAADVSKAWSIFSCDFGVYDTSKTEVGFTLAVR